MAGGAGSKRFDDGAFGFRSSCRSGAVTSVGDDVWRRIFDRCGSTTKAAVALPITTAAAIAETDRQVIICFPPSMQLRGPRLSAQDRPALCGTKGCHWTMPHPSARPEPVLAGRHRSGDGSGCAFKIVRGQISPRPTLARAGGSGAADPADSTLGGTLACRSHRWRSTP